MPESRTSINDLSSELLIRILTRIPTIDAIRSTLLVCPKWHNLWHQIPTLNFDMSLYHSPPRILSDSRESFARIITQALLLRPISTPLRSFRLVFNYRLYAHTQQQVDSWIRQAVTSGVKILHLSFEDEHFIKTEKDTFAKCDFHLDYLDGSSVSVLDLTRCLIKWSNTRGFLSLLTSVYLHDVSIKQDVLSAMVTNSVNLKYLCLSSVIGLKNFKIRSESLKELALGYFHPSWERAVGSLDICAPNLSKIVFVHFCVKTYRSSDLSSLVEADVNFVEGEQRDYIYCSDILTLLSGVGSLKVLSLSLNEYIFYGVVDMSCFDFRSVLMNLKYLELHTYYEECNLVSIGKFLKLCPQLETLLLDCSDVRNGTRSEEFKSKPIIWEIPSLKKVVMKNYNRSANELFIVEVLKTHKVALQKIVAFPRKVNGILPAPIVLLDTSW